MTERCSRFQVVTTPCERCATDFLKRRPWARFCSARCKNLHEKETAAANAMDAARYRALFAEPELPKLADAGIALQRFAVDEPFDKDWFDTAIDAALVKP